MFGLTLFFMSNGYNPPSACKATQADDSVVVQCIFNSLIKIGGDLHFRFKFIVQVLKFYLFQ